MAEKESNSVITEDTKEAKQLKKQQEKLQKEKEKREKKLEKERKKQEERERKQWEREEKARQKAQQRQKPASSDDGLKPNGSVEQRPVPTENDATEHNTTELSNEEPTNAPEESKDEPIAPEVTEKSKEEPAIAPEVTEKSKEEPAIAPEVTEKSKEEPAIAPEQHKDELANAPRPANKAEDTAKTPPATVTDEQVEDAVVAVTSWPEKVTVAEPPGQISGCGMPIGIVFNTAQAGQGALTASCIGTKAVEVPVDVTDLGKGVISVKMTPNIADIYTLNVKWAGREITGSPFTINLSLLPPAREETQPEQQKEIVVEKEEEPKMIEDEQKEQEAVDEASDDPFEMAFQASRLLEEQRQRALASQQGTISAPQTDHVAISNEQKETSPPPEAATNVSATHQQKSTSIPAQASTAATVLATLPTSQVNSSDFKHHQLYHSTPDASPSPEPFSPSGEEDTLSLQEANKALQETNVGLSGEVAILKKKMGEFEAKLSDIEESSRKSEEERRELSTQTSMRGWLYKRGIRGPTANVWRRRYFRCDQDCRIHYYRASNEAVPRGTIDVEMIESVEEVPHDPQTATTESTERFGFNITCTGRTYELQSEDDETRKQWISTIQYLKDLHQKNKTALLSSKFT